MSVTDLEDWSPIGDWLLLDGEWDDDGRWSDASVWLDTPVEGWTTVADNETVWGEA
jgi:hypothetical protein